jgi:hypothetical protein
MKRSPGDCDQSLQRKSTIGLKKSLFLWSMRKLSIYLIAALVFASCGRNSHKTADQGAKISSEETAQEKLAEQHEQALKEKYLTKGEEIASATQQELLKVVQGAMAAGGPGYAVEYCNIEALNLKDSLSKLNNCTIRRLSTKYRNPADKPLTEIEMEQLNSYEMLHTQGEVLNPSVHIVDDAIEYYKPIMIRSGACLLCHGDPGSQIAEETRNIIKELYPNDLATGYALNDFRGVWKITFMQ